MFHTTHQRSAVVTSRCRDREHVARDQCLPLEEDVESVWEMRQSHFWGKEASGERIVSRHKNTNVRTQDTCVTRLRHMHSGTYTYLRTHELADTHIHPHINTHAHGRTRTHTQGGVRWSGGVYPGFTVVTIRGAGTSSFFPSVILQCTILLRTMRKTVGARLNAHCCQMFVDCQMLTTLARSKNKYLTVAGHFAVEDTVEDETTCG